MKKTILSLILLLCVVVSAGAQTFKAPAKSSKTFTDTTTTFKYEMPEKTYNVYKTSKGAYYIWKISKKTGKQYKYYLPKEIQIQMGRKYEK